MIPESCPHCGMSWSGMSAQYHCGTYPIASLKGKTAQSIACKEIARLKAQLSQAQAERVVVPWEYCPECGSDRLQHEEGAHKQCKDCHQEWYSDIDYTDVVRQNLCEGKDILRPSSVPASRVLKDGEVAVSGEELAALREFADGWSEFRSQFDDIQYHHSGMGCGIEDRGIHDRYAACEHGWECAMERVAERFPEIDTLDALRAQGKEGAT